jgi:uncharacterized protein (TIGR02246 family)
MHLLFKGNAVDYGDDMSTTTSRPESNAKSLDPALAAAAQVVDQVNTAWAKNDANEFADLYTTDALFTLSGDRFFHGREHIRAALSISFQGPHKGTSLLTYVVQGHMITPDIAALMTEGGVLLPGQSEPDWERALRATWLVVREPDQKWRVAAYQNGRRADDPLKGDGEH